ncbi:hypothetical protein [Cystobacter fuscus]|uniref:hypothetical protein n=1 Tax=Cystobacter fuscus TaxID=43 RepID=UPI002B2BE316|nr:hypothetical protein F0U63_11570 [Cystobacter fuscus]
MRWAWTMGLVSLAVGLAGCPKPQILRFTATPSIVCPGDAVTLSWDTNGSAWLEAIPAISGLGDQARSGTQTLQVRESTRFRLEVTRGAKTALTESEVLTPPRPVEYGVVDSGQPSPFTCRTEERVLETTLSLEEGNLSPQVTLGEVRNLNARTLVMEKAGTSATLGEAARSSAFEGQPALGRWRLKLPLDEGERCEDALEAVDGRLLLQFQLSCPR